MALQIGIQKNYLFPVIFLSALLLRFVPIVFT